ncbi:MAG: hypothetical protein IJ251_02680 [Oscillospiraceae bacterium]|nr:hypothetical protein [Oscillospiraceae bacterium]
MNRSVKSTAILAAVMLSLAGCEASTADRTVPAESTAMTDSTVITAAESTAETTSETAAEDTSASQTSDDAAVSMTDTAPDDTASAETASSETAFTEQLPEENDAASLYAPVISEVLGAVQDGYDFDAEYRYIPEGIIERIMYEEKSMLLDGIGFVLTDISGDGTPELLIMTMPDEEYSTVYACYTCGSDGSIVRAFEGFARSSYTYTGSGTFFYIGSSGAAYTAMGNAHISTDAAALEWNDFWFTQPKDGDINNIGIYRNDTDECDPDTSELTDLTESDFVYMMERFGENAVSLPCVSLGTLSEAPDSLRTLEQIAAEGGLGEADHIISPEEGTKEGTWYDLIHGNKIEFYENRGQYVYTDSFGNTTEGDLVYNGDPEAPRYETVGSEDTEQIYFARTTEGITCMMAVSRPDGTETMYIRK